MQLISPHEFQPHRIRKTLQIPPLHLLMLFALRFYYLKPSSICMVLQRDDVQTSMFARPNGLMHYLCPTRRIFWLIIKKRALCVEKWLREHT